MLQGAAVLDLNADNTATPTANKGALALPRVSLASATAQLNGTAPITGMLVYNTNTTLGVGMYYWDGSTWVNMNNNYFIGSAPIAGLGAAAKGDRLEYDGSKWILVRPDTIITWSVSCPGCVAAAVGTTLSVPPNFPAGCNTSNSWVSSYSFPQFYAWTEVPGANVFQIVKVAFDNAAGTDVYMKCYLIR